MYYFWKLVYAIKYWRVFLQSKDAPKSHPHQSAPAESTALLPAASGGAKQMFATAPGKASVGTRLLLWLFFLGLVAVATASGFMAWSIHKRLQAQEEADLRGIAVQAALEAKRVERIRNRPLGPDRAPLKDTETCHVALSYTDPRTGAVRREQLKLTYMTICNRYRPGQTISARILDADPPVLVPDGDRMAWYWRWISLAVFGFLTSIVLFTVRAALASSRRGKT
jgi:hypothetical protein